MRVVHACGTHQSVSVRLAAVTRAAAVASEQHLQDAGEAGQQQEQSRRLRDSYAITRLVRFHPSFVPACMHACMYVCVIDAILLLTLKGGVLIDTVRRAVLPFCLFWDVFFMFCDFLGLRPRPHLHLTPVFVTASSLHGRCRSHR